MYYVARPGAAKARGSKIMEGKLEGMSIIDVEEAYYARQSEQVEE